jgi:hypothetical protein
VRQRGCSKKQNRDFLEAREVAESSIRALDGREQVTLIRLLEKLRKGDVVKFVKEIRMYDEEDWEEVLGGSSD